MNRIRVVLTGSTGMIGKGVLLECLDDPRVDSVLVVNRNPLGMSHPKLKEVLLKDFMHPEGIREELRGYDTVFFCLGVSAAGMSEAEYSKITFDYTINFAKVFLEVNANSTFIYVSGTGTDNTERGRVMWARVKGRTENAILKMGFRQAFMFRPGIIRPLRGIQSRTNWYRIMYKIVKPLWPLLMAIFGNAITDTTRIGKAMIHLAVNGSEERYFENRGINMVSS